MSQVRVSQVISITIKILAVGLILAVSFLPFVFVIINSFKTAQSFIFTDLDTEWTAKNYTLLFSNFDIFKYITNTLIIIAIVVLITMILSYFCAYCLYHTKKRFRNICFALFVFVSFIPMPLIYIPLYQFFATLRLIDTFVPLITMYTAAALPFAILYYSFAFNKIPPNVIRSAKTEGCNSFQIVMKIFFPATKNITFLIVTLIILMCLKDFFVAFVFAPSDSNRTIMVAITFILKQWSTTNYPFMFAVLATLFIPIIAIFLLIQKKIFAGTQSLYTEQ